MARIARVIAVGVPHHVVQRGNRRQDVFFSQEDRIQYLKILKEQIDRYRLNVWAYCLMSNHVHYVVVPENEVSLAKSIGETHRRYTRMINFRERWRGYLWQGRFSSFPLDERYLYAAVRYVEKNPVRARLVKKAEDYEWSSAKAHVYGIKDEILSENYLKSEISDWSQFLAGENNEIENDLIRKNSLTGRPLGSEEFIISLERKLGMVLRKQKPGPKLKN